MKNSDLQAEVDRLKKENARLNRKILALSTGLPLNDSEDIEDIRYVDDFHGHPTLIVNRLNTVYFESSNENTARLAKTIFCRPRLLKALQKGELTDEMLYDAQKSSTDDDWFDMTPKLRREFARRNYQFVRQINIKATHFTGEDKLIARKNGKYELLKALHRRIN